MRSGNPALKESLLQKAPAQAGMPPLTISGTVNKTLGLFLLLALSAAWAWSRFSPENPGVIGGMVGVGAIGGLGLAIAMAIKMSWATYLAPPYALLEGLAIGGMTAVAEARYPGIAVQAVGLTLGVFLCMLGAYKSGLIRATPKFMAAVVAATLAVALVYVADMLVAMIWHVRVPMIHESGTMGIAFSLVVVGIAALNLILDFSMIEECEAMGAPKYMEWYLAFGLMVTLVWLYLEILRLLMKLQDRR